MAWKGRKKKLFERKTMTVHWLLCGAQLRRIRSFCFLKNLVRKLPFFTLLPQDLQLIFQGCPVKVLDMLCGERVTFMTADTECSNHKLLQELDTVGASLAVVSCALVLCKGLSFFQKFKIDFFMEKISEISAN